MPHAHQHGNTAALHRELHKPNAILESEMQELARRAEEDDAIGPGAGEKVQHFKQRADVRLITLRLAMRCDGCYIDA